MTFKEFCDWCNARACDGCWGSLTAIACIDLMSMIRHTPFWKRKKAWKEIEQQVLDEIVNPINQKMKDCGITS